MTESISQSSPQMDGRRARSWWRSEAKQMKRDGYSLGDIAEKFGRSEGAAWLATREIKSTNPKLGRPYTGEVAGHQMGRKKRVAVSFTDKQIETLNIIAAERKVPFSKVVADLVDVAIEEIVS